MLQPFDELSLAEPGCPKDVVTVIPSHEGWFWSFITAALYQ